MFAFYLILWGSYMFYSKSKYFPAFLPRTNATITKWFGSLLLVLGTALFIYSDGWAAGLLLALVAYSLGFGLLQLFAVLGRVYFYSMLAVIHLFLLIDLISYAR